MESRRAEKEKQRAEKGVAMESRRAEKEKRRAEKEKRRAEKGNKRVMTAKEIIDYMESLRNEEQRRVLMGFFKTGPGEYGEGDEELRI